MDETVFRAPRGFGTPSCKNIHSRRLSYFSILGFNFTVVVVVGLNIYLCNNTQVIKTLFFEFVLFIQGLRYSIRDRTLAMYTPNLNLITGT